MTDNLFRLFMLILLTFGVYFGVVNPAWCWFSDSHRTKWLRYKHGLKRRNELRFANLICWLQRLENKLTRKI